ncbi:MAG TPA: aminotransferase class V-fold PLP-dependent enzyme [Bryobacteraceae bacterium]|jgi:L-seryl-tRNA(Ser) seleniumtransferase|nr:aminotransferase class V-fold PLP-dependent enzyme [Bryobacteraceae bacterium]
MSSFTEQRRTFMKWIAAAPVFGGIALQELSEKVAAAAARSTNVYERIGVRPLINARGTWTYLSGSLMFPEVRAAMEAASRQFVDMFELQAAVGKRLAALSGAESAMVTSGAAGAMAAATAACIAGSDPEKIWHLPETTGLKHEVVMLGGRNAFDSAIRLAGAKLVMAATVSDLPSALNDQTAMVYTTWRDDNLEKALEITRRAKVPLLLDDAAGIPPFENLSRYAKMGVDLYCFSGGKGMRGPQCAGLLLGRKDLIDAALHNYCPYEGSICRPMKAGKEEIIGMLTAVEVWKNTDLNALNREWNARVKRISKLVETVPGVTTRIYIPEDGNSYPTLRVEWDEQKVGLSVSQCDQQLRDGTPRIEVLTNSNPSMVSAVEEEHDPKHMPPQNRIEIISMTLQDGEDLIVGRRLREILSGARKRA